MTLSPDNSGDIYFQMKLLVTDSNLHRLKLNIVNVAMKSLRKQRAMLGHFHSGLYLHNRGLQVN